MNVKELHEQGVKFQTRDCLRRTSPWKHGQPIIGPVAQDGECRNRIKPKEQAG